MKYVLRLNFKGPIHIGSDSSSFGVEFSSGYVHSDTIYSALYNSICQMQNRLTPEFKTILEAIDNSGISISSFGFSDSASHKYYIPKPLLYPEIKPNDLNKSEEIKTLKKQNFVQISVYRNWQLNHFIDFENDIILEGNRTDRDDFWVTQERLRVLKDNNSAHTTVYYNGVSFYKSFVSPFIIIDCQNEKVSVQSLVTIFNLIGKNGLGGRRTIGCGQFSVDETAVFPIGNFGPNDLLDINPKYSSINDEALFTFNDIFCHKAQSFYLFSILYPETADTSAFSAYSLIPRKGWSFSTSSFQQMKRKSCYMMGEGSVLSKPVKGKILDLSPDEFNEHPVLRFGLPFYIPYK